MQSTQKLRERLLNEKQAITRVETSLQREIDKIGEELSMASRLTTRGAHSSVIRDLTARVSQLESRVLVINDFTNKQEITRKDQEEAMVKKEKELEGIEKLWNDCLNENDVMFEKFNEELVKISAGLKQGKGEVEVLNTLIEIKSEQKKLRRENMYVLPILFVT